MERDECDISMFVYTNLYGVLVPKRKGHRGGFYKSSLDPLGSIRVASVVHVDSMHVESWFIWSIVGQTISVKLASGIDSNKVFGIHIDMFWTSY